MSNLNKVSSNPNQQRARGYSAPKTGKIVDKSVSSRDILLQHFKGIGNQNRSSKTPTPMVRPIEGPGVFSIDLRQRSNEMSGYKDLENSVNVIVEESPEKSSKETPITNTEGFFTFRGKESCVMLKEEMKYEDIPIITVEDEIRKEIVGDVNLGNNDLCDAKANIVTKMDQDALKSDKLTQRVIVNTEKVIDTPNDHKKNAADVELSPEIIFESRTLLDFKNQDIQIIEKESTAPSQKPIEKRNLNVEKSIDLSVSASNIKTSPKLSSSPQNLPTAQDKTKINANKRNFESSPTQSILSFDQFMSQIDPKASYRSTSSMSNSYYNQSPKANTQSISSNQSKPITKYEQIKQQALEKEKIMVKRKKSVIKIQALVRGWICRKRVSVIKKRYLESQRRVKIRAVAERIKRSWAPYVILNGLRKWLAIRHKEKLEVYNMFLNYSALFIQKSYKGYTVRKRWLPLINARLQAKSAILSLAKGWKTRKIFKSKELKNIQISVRDMIKLVSEDPVDKTNPLLVKVRQQIPGLKQKFVQEFYKLYRKGSWVHYLPKAQSPKQDRSGILQKQDSSVWSYEKSNSISSSASPTHTRQDFEYENTNRDELPIKPLQATYNEIAEQGETEDTFVHKPPKKFTNFLKRGDKQKYDPLKKSKEVKPRRSIELGNSTEPNIEAIKDNDQELKIPKKHTEKPVKALDYSELEKQIEEATEEPEDSLGSKRNTTPHTYLKRKSQTYKPASKVEWKVQKRIDCWGSPVVMEQPVKKAKRKPNMPNINTTDLEQKPFIPIQDLEDIFNEILMGHISPNHYFLNRNEKNTSIPQFNEDSYFITHYSDDIYQDTLKVLDDHYQYLCNEEDSIMDKSMNNNY